LFISLPVNAAVEYTLKQSECKIVIDGEVYTDILPMLLMEPGYNYVPASTFRSICDKIGVGFVYDNTVKEIQLTTVKEETLSIETTPAPTLSPTPSPTPEPSEPVQLSDDTPIVMLGEYRHIPFEYVLEKVQAKGCDIIQDRIFYKLIRGDEVLNDFVVVVTQYSMDGVFYDPPKRFIPEVAYVNYILPLID
jgi:hypothetical protein